MVLCVSFGTYGLLRKKSGTRPIPGLFLETTLLTPMALLYLLNLQRGSALIFGPVPWPFALLLVSTGVVTGLPLVWFGHAARHLRLTTIGFLQYLAPSGSFLLGVFLYHEPFTRAHLITFLFIWTALAIFTVEAVLRWHSERDRVSSISPARGFRGLTNRQGESAWYLFSVASLKIAQRFNAGHVGDRNTSVPLGTTGAPSNKHGSTVPKGTSDSYAIKTQR